MTSADTILLIGSSEEKLLGVLKKLRYQVLIPQGQESIPSLVSRTPADLIVIDARDGAPCADLCVFLRRDELTRRVPVVVLCASAAQQADVEALRLEMLQVIGKSDSVGILAVKIATELRLRKMAGSEDAHASIAEINATLRDLNAQFKKEREEARKIQLSLLPRQLPQDKDFQLAVWYQPLDEVGGDWYAAERLPDGRLAFQVADVTGHGMGAALLASMTKLALHASASRHPGELLAAMNKLLSPELPDGRFVTFSSFLYDPLSGNLQYSRAGLPPALLVSGDSREARELKEGGFALGFLAEAEYETSQAVLKPGDSVLVYTDGITEALDRSDEMYSVKRLAQSVCSCPAGSSAHQVLAKIKDDFTKFIDGRKLKDDISVVLLSRSTSQAQ